MSVRVGMLWRLGYIQRKLQSFDPASDCKFAKSDVYRKISANNKASIRWQDSAPPISGGT